MGIIVQKYGGSSVATTEKIRAIAERVVETKREGHEVVVVVSAMGDATDELLAKAHEVAAAPDRRELDMLLSVGERISMALLAMAIRERGAEAVSLTGSQSGIITTASHTNARIMEVRPFRVQDELDAGRVVIVAGYQGVSYKRDITTLGRGGSDTTAVALAAALEAEACEIYSDVDGVFTADPRVAPNASNLPEIGYAEMQELAEAGAKVLCAQAVEFAKRKNIAIYARKTGAKTPGTVVRTNAPSAPNGVRGVAHERQVAAIAAETTLPVVRTFVRAVDDLGVGLKQQTLTLHGERASFSAVVSMDEYGPGLVSRIAEHFGSEAVRLDCGAVSLVGEGIMQTQDVLLRALGVLDALGAEVAGMSTSSFRLTLLVASEHVTEVVGALHEALVRGGRAVAVIG
ncbi:MAG: aspartate kinase [Deltaproteobacteria bacterium]